MNLHFISRNNSKTQTTETFNLLELIIEIVSFLQTSSLKDVLQLWTSAKKLSPKDRNEIIPKGIFWLYKTWLLASLFFEKSKS